MALCDICETEEQKVAFGLLDSGDWKYLCPGCWMRASLDLIKEIMPAEEIAAVLGPMFVTPSRSEAIKEQGKKTKGKRQAAPEPEKPAEEPPQEQAQAE